VSLRTILFPPTPACQATQYNPTVCRVEISFNAFWHCRAKEGDVLTAWRAHRDTWLPEQILTYFSGLSWVSVLWTQANIAYILTWKL
jgi:hypothetical protein